MKMELKALAWSAESLQEIIVSLFRINGFFRKENAIKYSIEKLFAENQAEINSAKENMS